MTPNDKQQGVAAAQQARVELYSTLSQLKDRLNYAQRIDSAVDDARAKIADQKRKNPVAFVAGVVGAAAVAGAIVWGVASAAAKRLR